MKNTSSFPLYFIFFLAFFFCSCRKNGSSGTNPTDNFASPTFVTPVTTNLVAYAYENDNANNPLQVINYGTSTIVSVLLNSKFDGYFAGPVIIDKYLSHVGYNTGIRAYDYGFNQYKAFNISSGFKNYLGFKSLSFTNIGNVRNLGGPYTLGLPGNGTLAFPFESFDSINHLDMNYNILVNYLDPTARDFAVSLPNLSMADDKGYRWFLNSYGVYQIRPVLTYCNCNILYQEDYFEKMVTMRMPIAPDQLSSAPDSIEAWHLNMHTLVWEQNGFAYKYNGAYEKKIREYGVWNLAKREYSIYLTIQLRTTNSFPIPNTRFVVKSKNNEIVEGRTDIEGNALLLVPANWQLSFNIINDHFRNYLNLQLADQNLGSYARESIVKVTLPDRNDLGTLEGAVYNCDGTSFGNGALVISQTGARDDYIVPINDGKFITANWLNSGNGDSKLSFLHANGNIAFEVNTCLSGSAYNIHLKRLKESFYGCPTADSLFCYFQIDKNPANRIHGDVNHSAPILLAKKVPGSTDITINDGGKGISFSMWILGGSTGEFITSFPLTVNNVACQFNSSGNSELTIYRNDDFVNGFIEGWYAIDYLDPANNPHIATGNFRLKIID